MTKKRFPLAFPVGSRDSTASKDALLMNCFAEKDHSGEMKVVRRFGYTATGTNFTAGQALGLFPFQNTYVAIVGTTAYLGTTSLGTVDGTSQYQFSLTGTGTTFVIKNNAAGYYYNGTTLAKITDSNYPATTVPGVVTLDGTTYVMTAAGQIMGSNINTPATYNALNAISSFTAADVGVALTRYLNYVIAFNAASTTFLYDNANPTGSPLLPNQGATINVGCASGNSVVATKNTVIWIGQTRQRGRSVYLLDGINATPISDTHIDRLLNADDLSTVYATFIEISGHYLYILTLKKSNKTLVYDLQTQQWHVWASSGLGTGLSATAPSVDSFGTVTLTVPNHGLTSGTLVNITGAGPGQYRGQKIVNAIDANTLTYTAGSATSTDGINYSAIDAIAVNVAVATKAGNSSLNNITVTPYNQNYFRCPFYAYAGNVDYLIDETTGALYRIGENLSNDNGTLIYSMIRTAAGDLGSNIRKQCKSVELIGDRINDVAYIGYSDTDFQTYSFFRPVNLAAHRPQLRRCGMFRRRAWQIVHVGNYQFRFYAMEADLEAGEM